MVFPIPDRVSPSGPLANPITNPAAQLAGRRYVYGGQVDEVILSYPGKIGPLGDVPANPLLMYDGAQTYVPAGNTMALRALGAPMGVTPGLWLVEADLSVGFNTSPAAQGNNNGSLNMTVGLYTPAGVSAIVAGSRVQSPIPRSVKVAAAAAEPTLQPTHSTKMVAEFELTVAQFQAAGAVPLVDLVVAFTRVDTIDANGAGVGPYTATSGILEFTRDCSLLLRRIG